MVSRVIFLSFLIIFFSEKVKTQEVDGPTAKNAAAYFYKQQFNKPISEIFAHTVRENGVPVYHIFNFGNSDGFVIISAEKKAYPVLAYSKDGLYKTDFDSKAHKKWMENYQKQILSVKNTILKDASAKADEISQAWKNLLEGKKQKSLKSTDNYVAPLIQSKWAQGSMYNNDCPEDSAGPAGHVRVGCVAVSMGQCMRYHNHPIKGTGSHGYTHSDYGYLEADFANTTYDWSNMPYEPYQSEAELTRLLFHCGVAVNMNYGPEKSGAYTSVAKNSLVYYFNYSANTSYEQKNNYDNFDWLDMIKKELDASRPLMYSGFPLSGSGHSFICDGYENSFYLHFNWGWGGDNDGYYAFNDLTPDNYNFNNNNSAIIGLEPHDSFTDIKNHNFISLSDSIEYNGSTTNGISYINRYQNYYHYTGKEVIHKLFVSDTGDLTIYFLNHDDKLRLFILDSSSVNGYFNTTDSIIKLENVRPGYYYLMVDGKYGFSGDYTLLADFISYDYNLLIDNQTISDTICHQNQKIDVSFNFLNHGNKPTDTCKTFYYLSKTPSIQASSIILDSLTMKSLAGRDTLLINDSLNIPNNLDTGMYFLITHADAKENIIEGNENDNYAIQKLSVGVEQHITPIHASGDINIFPNPVSDFLNIVSQNTIIQITINNINGNTLYTIQPTSQQHTVDFTEFPNNIYIIQILTDKCLYHKKIIKE